jgi:hypothetical protein
MAYGLYVLNSTGATILGPTTTFLRHCGVTPGLVYLPTMSTTNIGTGETIDNSYASVFAYPVATASGLQEYIGGYAINGLQKIWFLPFASNAVAYITGANLFTVYNKGTFPPQGGINIPASCIQYVLYSALKYNN